MSDAPRCPYCQTPLDTRQTVCHGCGARKIEAGSAPAGGPAYGAAPPPYRHDAPPPWDPNAMVPYGAGGPLQTYPVAKGAIIALGVFADLLIALLLYFIWRDKYPHAAALLMKTFLIKVGVTLGVVFLALLFL